MGTAVIENNDFFCMIPAKVQPRNSTDPGCLLLIGFTVFLGRSANYRTLYCIICQVSNGVNSKNISGQRDFFYLTVTFSLSDVFNI